MDIKIMIYGHEKLKRRVNAQSTNEKMRQEIRSKVKDYKNELQDTRYERKELFQPITKVQEETKNTIDKKQDKIIEKLREGQNTMAQSIEALSEAVSKQCTQLGYPVKEWALNLPSVYEGDDVDVGDDIEINKDDDVDVGDDKNDFTEAEKIVISHHGFDPSFKKLPFHKRVRQEIQQLNGKRHNLDVDIKNKAHYKQKLLSKYFSALKEQGKTGTGYRRYKQPKRNAYKVRDGQYGGLLINVPRLMNEMVIEAQKGGSIVYENKADKSLIDLLTKRFDPKKRYSSIARRVFNDLNLLSGIPSHKSSGKTNLIGGAIYYSKPEDLMIRLRLVTGSRTAGNTNLALRNEAWELIDKL